MVNANGRIEGRACPVYLDRHNAPGDSEPVDGSAGTLGPRAKDKRAVFGSTAISRPLADPSVLIRVWVGAMTRQKDARTEGLEALRGKIDFG